MWRYISRYFCKTLLLIIIIILRCRAGFVSNTLPLWTWECVNDRCIPTHVISSSKLQSLHTCNMLCASMQLWPQPTGRVSLSTTAVPVRADLFQLQVKSAPSKAVHEHLQAAFELFREDLRFLEQNSKGFTDWRSVAVQITVNGSSDPRMRIDTDESYILKLKPQAGVGSPLITDIIAKSFCGVVRGLATLSQLVWFDPYLDSLLSLEAANVEDTPRFRYRGLMLDTARNFYPLNDIIRTIDAMAASKLNTFHWRVSDSQAFSVQLVSVPQLTHHGDYGPGAIYSMVDVRKIVQHARLRGIRVLLEMDTPGHVGHAWSWGTSVGIGDLVQCVDAEPWSAYCTEPPCGQLNPRNTRLYQILEAIYSEIMRITGVDDLFHLGGAEISMKCWEEQFKDNEPMELWLEFTRLALQHLQNSKLPNLTLLWTSPLSEHIKTDLKDYAHSLGLQARSAEWAQKYVNGIRTVISHEDAWDLNDGLGAWHENAGGAPYNSWQRVYEHRPWVRGGVGCVEGGEATVWSSTLSSGGLDARVWPRAAALAERLWSDRAEGATRPVHARLDVHRSRLVARGVKVAPLWSMWCTHNTYTCG